MHEPLYYRLDSSTTQKEQRAQVVSVSVRIQIFMDVIEDNWMIALVNAWVCSFIVPYIVGAINMRICSKYALAAKHIILE